MMATLYDQWPFAWLEVAAEAVTRWHTAPRRHTTTATIMHLPPAVVRRCVTTDLRAACVHPDRYNEAQRRHLESVGRVLGADVPLRQRRTP